MYTFETVQNQYDGKLASTASAEPSIVRFLTGTKNENQTIFPNIEYVGAIELFGTFKIQTLFQFWILQRIPFHGLKLRSNLFGRAQYKCTEMMN